LINAQSEEFVFFFLKGCEKKFSVIQDLFKTVLHVKNVDINFLFVSYLILIAFSILNQIRFFEQREKIVTKLHDTYLSTYVHIQNSSNWAGREVIERVVQRDDDV
jgi:hypothetical protein